MPPELQLHFPRSPAHLDLWCAVIWDRGFCHAQRARGFGSRSASYCTRVSSLLTNKQQQQQQFYPRGVQLSQCLHATVDLRFLYTPFVTPVALADRPHQPAVASATQQRIASRADSMRAWRSDNRTDTPAEHTPDFWAPTVCSAPFRRAQQEKDEAP